MAQKTDHVPGDLMVMLKKESDAYKVVHDLSELNGIATEIKPAKLLSESLNIWQLHFNENTIDENLMLMAVRSQQDVLIAQFNHYVELRNTPNDAGFGQQWNMLNIGQVVGSIPGSDIRAASAWDITTGGMTVGGDTIVVCINDAGFDLVHEDLRYWKNYDEIPGNSNDDDNNGYVDDYDGWNSLDNNGTIPSSTHGTHVSGIAGAKGNNGIGVAGVNWNVKIMPVRGYSGVESIVIAGYSYIMDMRRLYNETDGVKGAFVVSVNSSFGIDGPTGNPGDYPLWCAMYDSMGLQGILNATATTNNNKDVDIVSDMPTACPSDYMISVTSTTNTDQKYTGGFGLTTIDIGAPGKDIYSTYPGNLYSTATGTSSASPHIAGAVALIYSLPCEELVSDFKTDPAGAALRIKGFIMQSADPLIDLQGITVSGGRLNVYKALLLAGEYYNCNVGMEDLNFSNHELLVYPNPAHAVLNVILKDQGPAEKTFIIKNSIGQTVLTETNTTSVQLDVSGLPKGFYLITVHAGNEVLNITWIKE